mmetsp:Transcript_15477/g.38534  ORF Transcript_15477/g.38534 Transcript_15477/m.38534 type:complete len:217 (+) Transcript_15477:342-992(+)|eukprot:CAMPEP_0202866582 /NCGR_PEP_ID=MMETSP1391-20130828/8033_1 /ASSEMBLY_ACC=CAM_ASM_000867 /TAXON_ID=1034604 /ORGANISM="Chlamydomonas leiostraca, Strain SAG 11-49" /LENGTH=216 /DNA_ID=CAMNT_0049546545 /DNA_START=332 /DNA_END=982 /DNA_ORIENTATION=-
MQSSYCLAVRSVVSASVVDLARHHLVHVRAQLVLPAHSRPLARLGPERLADGGHKVVHLVAARAVVPAPAVMDAALLTVDEDGAGAGDGALRSDGGVRTQQALALVPRHARARLVSQALGQLAQAALGQRQLPHLSRRCVLAHDELPEGLVVLCARALVVNAQLLPVACALNVAMLAGDCLASVVGDEVQLHVRDVVHALQDLVEPGLGALRVRAP